MTIRLASDSAGTKTSITSVGQDRCAVAMYADTRPPSSQIGPRKNDSHLALRVLIVFFPPSPFPFPFPFPIYPGLPPAITCPHMFGCAGPGPLLLWIWAPVMRVVDSMLAKAGVDIDWADSNLGGDSMPVYGRNDGQRRLGVLLLGPSGRSIQREAKWKIVMRTRAAIY
ncbi:hypothetical protein B0H13DRAFT_2345849 [Mycena leptocephala]|nr:hypothetical protein B0H13DRAFT_2345849 [Mycena leptocephala]